MDAARQVRRVCEYLVDSRTSEDREQCGLVEVAVTPIPDAFAVEGRYFAYPLQPCFASWSAARLRDPITLWIAPQR